MLLPLALTALSLFSATRSAPALGERNNPTLLPNPSGGIMKTNPVYIAGSDFDFESFVSLLLIGRKASC